MQVECCLIQEDDTENPTEDEEQVEELDLTGLDDVELDKVWVLFIVYSQDLKMLYHSNFNMNKGQADCRRRCLRKTTG